MKKKYLLIGLFLAALGTIAFIFGILINSSKIEWIFTSKAVAIILFILSGVSFLLSFSFLNRLLRPISIKEMAVISIQAALCIVLYYIGRYFKMPFTPSWLDFQLSEVPALITSYIYGPLAGSLVIILRFLFKLPMTLTLGVGELADLLLGLTLVIIAGLIYQKKRTFKDAISSYLVATLACIVVAVFANWFILIPAYTNIAGFSMEALINGMSYVKSINETNFMFYYIMIGVLPFNIIRYLAVGILTFILYKNVHKIFDKFTK